MDKKRPQNREPRRVRFLTGCLIIASGMVATDQWVTDGHVRAAAKEVKESFDGSNDSLSQQNTPFAPGQPSQVNNPDSKWVGNPEAYNIIDSLNLPSGHKNYLKFTFECTVKALNAGNQENPATLVGMSALETGWGTDGLSPISNNHYGINGVGDAGTVNMNTREVINGEDAYRIAGFKAYSDPCGSHLDMAPMHQLEHYRDIATCSDTPEHMLNAVQHYADPQTCEIIAYQGEPLPGGGPDEKVLGHATDPDYIATVLNIIDLSRADELFLPA